MKTGIEKIITKIAAPLLIFFLLAYLYTLLHEGGHALVGIIYGGRIDSFVLGFNAHVAIREANFTQIGESLFNSAGVLLPAIDPEVMMQYFEEKGYEFFQEQIDRLEELFTKNRDDEFIPVSFSAVIQ